MTTGLGTTRRVCNPARRGRLTWDTLHFRCAVITGVSSGIGLATARVLKQGLGLNPVVLLPLRHDGSDANLLAPLSAATQWTTSTSASCEAPSTSSSSKP